MQKIGDETTTDHSRKILEPLQLNAVAFALQMVVSVVRRLMLRYWRFVQPVFKCELGTSWQDTQKQGNMAGLRGMLVGCGLCLSLLLLEYRLADGCLCLQRA